MNNEIKSLGYLLIHYQKSQCYDQYIPLKWLLSEIEKRIDAMSLYNADCEMKGYDYIKELLKG